MRRSSIRLLIVALAATVGARAADVPAQPLRLHRLFTDRAVLQRDHDVPVYGWAPPDARVRVTLGTQQREASAGADGRWRVVFPPLRAGGPALSLRAVCGTDSVSVDDLLVGDVWVCGGQSNMELAVSSTHDAQHDLATAGLPRLRLLTVPHRPSAAPEADLPAASLGWRTSTPEVAADFSAVGFFFGRELLARVDVPIGLISSCWGGTSAQAWTSRDALAAEPELMPIVQAADAEVAQAGEQRLQFAKAWSEWEQRQQQADVAALGDAVSPTFDDGAWPTMELPAQWEQHGLPDYDGVVYFRRHVRVDAPLAGRPLRLDLGPVDDQDTTWWDGKRVGSSLVWDEPREYALDASQTAAGEHVLVVRVVDIGGAGGIDGTPTQLALRSSTASLPLTGAWRYHVGAALVAQPQPPSGPANPNHATALRYGMISPLTDFPVRGVIWYQGEANAGHAWQYRTLFPTVIRDWRTAWRQDDLPFLFVQLAAFTPAKPEPGESDWAELRDAQLHTLRTVPHTGMAVAIDVGDANDIHPRDKRTVGLRLSRWALAGTYGMKDVECSGPVYTSATVDGDAIRIAFDHCGLGHQPLRARGDGPLKGFAIAGEDRRFVWADARIDGQSVVVRSAQVPHPVAVRYAWASNPEGCNLVNAHDLPASPFRSDDFPPTSR